ncbi:DUF2867 domain-containing protein [Streptomyces sp. SID10853]|uniref:DUF2867 domain-containing protein n=1 Tax=Streptomyces sp. SID10853 TaxID=2706028 RepID=UPI0013BF59A1|nr:DUF2867 domain-containing protein [Streptomyces sp. SID10853]NDZ78419.1 DUF2867 domain-containing protein [Streptomyces sp. SID10853]
MTHPRVRRVEVPQAARTAGESATADYASAFELRSRQARSGTPEQWARATFEDAPAVVRWILLRGWTLVLGLRMGPRPSPGHVLGWELTESGSASVTLDARSPLIAARNVVVVDDSGVVWVTFVRYHRRLSRLVWAAAAPVHHLAVPWLLGLAGRKHTASRGPRS